MTGLDGNIDREGQGGNDSDGHEGNGMAGQGGAGGAELRAGYGGGSKAAHEETDDGGGVHYEVVCRIQKSRTMLC